MRLLTIPVSVWLLLPGLLYAQEKVSSGTEPQESASFICRTTVPEGGNGGVFGNDVLEVVLATSKFVFEPGGIGFQAVSDGALGVKIAWNRKRKGRLTIEGRRLDGAAAPARASIPDSYGYIGGQSTYVLFPTPGCWEITGHVAGGSFSFVVLVEKIGNGPSWRLDL